MATSGDFQSFRSSYLRAFLCAASSDWLKGPYIYRLYEARGFGSQEITVFFAAGYMSSAVFGVLAGVMIDMLGRKKACLSFCALYILHCALHGAADFYVLLLARAVSGVATALLFSAFEAWVVAEHKRRFPKEDLGAVFALQTQGNALSAVAAGIVAQGSVELGGYGAPFAVAVPLLLFCSWEVCKWPENVGSAQRDASKVVKKAIGSMNSVVVRVGLLQCLFEGSMHVFVFLWTPCLQRGGTHVAHGLVFSLYMACMMVGGKVCASRFRPPLPVVFGLSAACLAVPSVLQGFWVALAAFCCFEWCVGCYFPQIALLRSVHLQDETRAATITLFRVPFNCIVVAVLIYGRALPAPAMLLFASGALAAGTLTALSMPQREAAKKD